MVEVLIRDDCGRSGIPINQPTSKTGAENK